LRAPRDGGPETAHRAVKEYLEVLDDAAFGAGGRYVAVVGILEKDQGGRTMPS
jgi:hypothetical protein